MDGVVTLSKHKVVMEFGGIVISYETHVDLEPSTEPRRFGLDDNTTASTADTLIVNTYFGTNYGIPVKKGSSGDFLFFQEQHRTITKDGVPCTMSDRELDKLFQSIDSVDVVWKDN